MEGKQNLIDIFQKLDQIAKVWDMDEGIAYTRDPYQIYIAATLLSNDGCWNFLQLDPGQGKTVIMILMIHYYSKENSLPCAIVTDLPHLESQLIRVTKEFRFTEGTISVISFSSLNTHASHNDLCVYFVDEADDAMSKHLVDFTPSATL